MSRIRPWTNGDQVSLENGRVPTNNYINGTISTDNSTSTPLTAGSTFTGTAEEITNYAIFFVTVATDQDSATDGLEIQQSHDGTNWDFIDYLNITGGDALVFPFNPAARYYRIVYTNGSVNQTYFRLQTIFKQVYCKPSSHIIQDSIKNDDASELVKAVITGQRKDTSSFENVETDKFNRLQVQDKTAVTAFGDLRTAEITPIIQLAFDYTVDNTELTTNTTAGTGTVTQSDASAVINSGTTASSTAELRSYLGARYRAGLGGLARFTARFTTGVASTSQWAGILDESGSSYDFKNGFAIGYNGADFGIARFQNDSLNFTALADCDDPLDGTGHSEMTIDPTKLNVFYIQYQYLGAGAIRFFVEDDSTGQVFVFHTINYANKYIIPHVYNSNFYLRFFVDNKATTNELEIGTCSCAYFTEGKTKYYEIQQPQFSTGLLTLASVTTEVALFTIGNKSTYASKTNFIGAALERLTIGVYSGTGNSIGKWRLIRNTTLGGTPSYSDIDTNNSIMEIDTAGTTVSGGKTILSGSLFGNDDKTVEDISSYDIILNPGETLTLAVQNTNSSTFVGSLLWKELF